MYQAGSRRGVLAEGGESVVGGPCSSGRRESPVKQTDISETDILPSSQLIHQVSPHNGIRTRVAAPRYRDSGEVADISRDSPGLHRDRDVAAGNSYPKSVV